MNAREKLEAASAVYASAGKNVARAVMVGLVQQTRALTILDLWGGGESARMFRQVMPDAAVISAESDEQLWPVLMQDAQEHGYVAHLGDVAEVPGRYDVAWLDLCSQASETTQRVIASVAKKVSRGGYLAITIMPARENERILTGEARLLHLPLWLEGLTGARVRLLLPYRRDNGLPMWFVLLTNEKGVSWFHDEERFRLVKASLVDIGYWSDGLTRALPESVYALLGAREWVHTNTQAPEPLLVEPSTPKRVMKLSELDPAARHLVLTLIEAGKSGREHRLESEWQGDPPPIDIAGRGYYKHWEDHRARERTGVKMCDLIAENRA